jgi:hypothetical protein
MDPCNPESNIDNVRASLRTNLGVPKSYATKFSRKNACSAFRVCKSSNVFPPLKLDKAGGYIYFIDPESPLSAREYRLLFETGKIEDVRKIAKKLKVVKLDEPKVVLRATIVSILSKMDLTEPIKAMKISAAKNISTTPLNNGNKNLFMSNNKNKNKNLFRTPTNNKNLFGTPTNNKNLFVTPTNNGNKNKNLFGTPTNNKNLIPAVNMKNPQITDESEPFKLGRPKVKAPTGLSERSITNKLNSISNNLSYISERAE